MRTKTRSSWRSASSSAPWKRSGRCCSARSNRHARERRAFKLPLLDGMVEALRSYELGIVSGPRRAHLALHNGCKGADGEVWREHECDESFLPQPGRKGA